MFGVAGRGWARPTLRWGVAAMFVALAGCAGRSPPVSVSVSAAPGSPPPGMQYLYGSAEAAALDIQTFGALTAFVERQAEGRASVVLAADAAPDRPAFTACGDRPPAVVFDMDETLVLNLGYEMLEARSGKGFDADRWSRWEMAEGVALMPLPGAVEAVAALRRRGVTPIVNTNRSAASAATAVAALAKAGFGPFRHGETLFLAGDVDGQRRKDGRRQEIARRFCVIAMVGDQLGDFSDGFQGDPVARRALATAPAIARLWGQGWFVLPNPVYGSGLAGDWDAVFPADKRWSDPVEGQGK
nr:HAD family acid phosphatase [Sphingomonas sp. Y57]